ncbi:MAG: zinc-dependent metalloprotease [Candidatus Acidoferrales bacterium]
MRRSVYVCLSAFVLVCAIAFAPVAVAQGQRESQEGPPRGERGGRGDEPPKIKPYEEVITEEAVSDPGVFTVHRIKEKFYYEIPPGELGQEFLWVSQIAKTTLGVGYGGQAVGNRVVRWERHGDRVLLRNVSYSVVADKNLPIARAVEAANANTIIMAFNIAALGENDAPVIDVTRLFSTEVAELSARRRLQARGFDTKRSFVERIVSFPRNIEVEATHTFTRPPDPQQRGRRRPQPRPRPSPFGGAGMRPGSATVVMHYSMVKLPEKPMMPRLHDQRVGYISIRQTDYGRDKHRATERRYITRWRLEKKNPNARLSEPVKPIEYYVDPATPAKWVPYVKRGIEKWQEAFEEAGFKKAIVARDAPSPAEDPDWSPEDARYSVIRWLPSTIQNASGPHIHDPRTGEILESDIQMYHNVMNLVRDWYFLQAGPLDPRAQKLPLPDDLMGTLIEYVVAHEVGHTLGYPHNMKASSMYTLEQVRDREWVKKMGHTPTLMDYSRFNYVAQPEDKIDLADLVPKIGPYDKWVTMWGYKPIPGAQTPDDEKETLNQWALQQDETPWFRFTTPQSNGSDPGQLTEAVGDADAVQATALGLKNLERVADMLLSATAKPGEPYDDLEELYGRLLGQWVLEMNHVAALVGGFHSRQKHAGQDGVRFVLVPREKQARAVEFLAQHAFSTPSFMIKPEILRRIEPVGVLNRVKTAQQRVLNSLLSSSRFTRLVEQEAIDGAAAYPPSEFLADVHAGIWSELGSDSIKIDAFRRNLQRAYLDLLDEKLNGRQPVTDDARPFFRGELRLLAGEVVRSLAQAADRATLLHLEDVRDQIDRALNPRFLRPSAEPATPRLPGLDGGWSVDPFSVGDEPLVCWPDYEIPRQND